MEAIELLRLAKWYDKNTRENDLVKKYNALITKINSNIQPNTQSQAFETEKSELINVVKFVDLSTLSMAQIAILEKLEVKSSFGLDVAREISEIFVNHQFDLNTIKDKLSLKVTKINESTNKFTKMKEGLLPLVDYNENNLELDDIIMRVRFDREVAIHNIADLKKWGSQLELLMRSIAELNNQRVEDVKVISAEHGSIIYVLKVSLEIARDMGVALAAILGCVKLYYDIQIKKEELSKMKLSSEVEKNVSKELDKEQKKILDETSKNVVHELVKNIDPKDIEEAGNKLSKGIDVLIKLIKGGGDIDISTPDLSNIEDSDSEEIIEKSERMFEIREQFKAIKENQNIIKLLEHNIDIK